MNVKNVETNEYERAWVYFRNDNFKQGKYEVEKVGSNFQKEHYIKLKKAI